MPIITDTGFSPDDTAKLTPAADMPEAGEGLRIAMPNDADPAALLPHFNRIALIAVDFPSAHDGRGYSIGRRLRDLGFRGHLRASGHVITDQYHYARACGFDDVAIPEALAERQPEEQWIVAANAALPPFRRRPGMSKLAG